MMVSHGSQSLIASDLTPSGKHTWTSNRGRKVQHVFKKVRH
jgi:hypothetical protein